MFTMKSVEAIFSKTARLRPKFTVTFLLLLSCTFNRVSLKHPVYESGIPYRSHEGPRGCEARIHISAATAWFYARSTVPWYSLYRRMSGPQDKLGREGVMKISTPPPSPGVEPVRSSPYPSGLPL